MADEDQGRDPEEKDLEEGQPAKEGGENKPQEGEKAEEGEKGKEEKSEEVLPADQFEPEVRQKPWKNRQERAEFFKAKKRERDQEEERDELGDEFPDEEKQSQRMAQFEKKLDDFANRQDEILVKNEINAFLADSNNVGLRKYAKLAEKAAKVYSNVPISFIFQGLAYQDAFSEGANRAEEVRQKTGKHKILGTSTRKVASKIPDFTKMTPEQIEDFNQKLPREGIKVEE